MAENLTDKESLTNLLQSKKIAERQAAIKNIAQNKIVELGNNVLSLLGNELETRKSWQFILEIINCLAALKYKGAVPLLSDICKVNEAHDMITAASATALCTINRLDSTDVQTEIDLLRFGKFAVVNGALKALNNEKIVPADKDKLNILEKVSRFEPRREKGYADIRMGLASACAGWLNLPEVKAFLEECLNGDSPLVKVAQASLKGKYTPL